MCPPVPPPAMMTESGRGEGETGRGGDKGTARPFSSPPLIFVSCPGSLISRSPCLLASSPLLFLLDSLFGHVQYNSDRRQYRDQRRPARADERQRNAFGRDQVQDHTHVKERLDYDTRGQPDGEQHSKSVGRAESGAQPPPQEESEDERQRNRPRQPKLFGDHREDKIGLRLGQKQQFLLPLPESEAVYAARTDRDQRLQNLIALALRVAFGVDKSQHAIPAPDYFDHEVGERGPQYRQELVKTPHRSPGGEEHCQKDNPEHQGRPQIRLFQNQHREQSHHHAGGGDRRPEIIQLPVALTFRQEPRQEYD